MNNLDNICVVGLGYVGLPIAVAFAKKYNVVAFDININRIKELKKNLDRTFELESDKLDLVKTKIKYTTSILDAEKCNIYIVTVPTPIDSKNRPNLQPLIDSSKLIGSVIKKDDLVIYESTVYPGVTEEVCVPVLSKVSGLEFNKDFFCGYSPERINPGDKKNLLENIIKVTSGSNPEAAKKVDRLYSQIISAGTKPVKSIKVAEASKVIENTQRDVNIALINELSIIFNQMNIDTNEVLEASATKWNFIDIKPGLVGGHCIGVDPYYLTFRAQEFGYKPNLILAARQINNGMSSFIVGETIKLMITSDIRIKNSDVLIMGLTFKENCADMRNSKVIDMIEEFLKLGCNVDVYDPWVSNDLDKKRYSHGVIGNPFLKDKKYDTVIVAVAHEEFKKYTSEDLKNISKKDNVIIDIKNTVSNPTWRL